ncbi:MAG: hypothetical protein HYX52_06510 [Chloroflexi bacterium]|nr:hypothetical protein [Chloroflexota bacterium]
MSFIPILLVYGTKERALITALPVGLIGAAVAWFNARHVRSSARGRQIRYAVIVGLVMAQLTWALGYWAVIPLVGAAALWLALYALSGIAEHAQAATLDRRVAAEFGAVAAIGVVIVLFSQPWRA